MATKRNKDRAEGMTILAFSLSEDEKKPLRERADKIARQRHLNFTMSDLCRLAVFYHEKRGWKDIPDARIEPE